jgi:hypothetical protein
MWTVRGEEEDGEASASEEDEEDVGDALLASKTETEDDDEVDAAFAEGGAPPTDARRGRREDFICIYTWRGPRGREIVAIGCCLC